MTLHAKPPCVECLEHEIKQPSISWAWTNSRLIALLFERLAIDVSLATQTVKGAQAILGTTWDEAWHILRRAVASGQASKTAKPIASVRIYIYEKEFRKGPHYLPLLYDLDRNMVEAMADGNDTTNGWTQDAARRLAPTTTTKQQQTRNSEIPKMHLHNDNIAAFILTFNEEKHIAECIESVSVHLTPSRIFILDGGSIDNTVMLAKNSGAIVVELPGSSIAERRGYAIENAAKRFVMFIDADQRLKPHYDLTSVLAKHFVNDDVAGVQFRLNAIAVSPNYWTAGFAARHQIITTAPGHRAVIGTPCIFDKTKIKNLSYNKNISGPADDTEFCHNITRLGLNLIVINEEADEVVRASLRGTILKAYWYGLGDAELINAVEPKKKANHLHHVMARELLWRPASILFSQNYKLVFFFIIFGITRNIGLILGMLNRKDLSATRS